MLKSKGVDDWKSEAEGGLRVIILEPLVLIVPILTYLPKVRARWSQAVGDSQSWKTTIARVSLRKSLGKEPSAKDVNDFITKQSASEHEKLVEELEDDVVRALRDKNMAIALRRTSPYTVTAGNFFRPQ